MKKYQTMIVKKNPDGYFAYIYNDDPNDVCRHFPDCRFINDIVGKLNEEGWYLSAFENFTSMDCVLAFTREVYDE